MTAIILRRRPVRISLSRVFRKAVIGHKKLKEKEMPIKEVTVLRTQGGFEGLTGPIVEPGKAGLIPSGLPTMPAAASLPSPVKIEADKISVKEKSGGILRESKTILRVKKPEVDFKTINIVYALIPSKTKIPFASANIRWSNADSALVCSIIEPKLTQQEKELLENIKKTLIEKLDVDFTALRKGEARNYLRKRFEETINIMAATLPEDKRQELLYYVERDFVGLGKIEPFMQDPNIEDISCDGVGIPIYIFHRNPLIGSIRTNVQFDDAEELDVFVSKLAQRCGKNISIAAPLIGGSLPDGSRVQATLGTDIARRGSNFTIRKFTKKPLTPIHLINFKTIDPKIAAFLWVAVEYGRSILMSGGVASGKTTLLNALSLFIKPELKVVSIEDTAELVLPHPHWVPSVARLAITELEGKKVGEVDLFDLLKESLRQRPDYLIVGEVRGREAYVLFQQIATGHSSMSTIHADSFARLVDRMTTPPISLPATLIEALDLIVFIVRMKYGQGYVRRVKSIYEITGFDREKNIPLVNIVFRWNPMNDVFEEVNPSTVLDRISQQYGITVDFLKNEISRRVGVLNWMVEKDVIDYINVAKIIKMYYTKPEDVLEAII